MLATLTIKVKSHSNKKVENLKKQQLIFQLTRPSSLPEKVVNEIIHWGLL